MFFTLTISSGKAFQSFIILLVKKIEIDDTECSVLRNLIVIKNLSDCTDFIKKYLPYNLKYHVYFLKACEALTSL